MFCNITYHSEWCSLFSVLAYWKKYPRSGSLMNGLILAVWKTELLYSSYCPIFIKSFLLVTGLLIANILFQLWVISGNCHSSCYSLCPGENHGLSLREKARMAVEEHLVVSDRPLIQLLINCMLTKSQFSPDLFILVVLVTVII